MDLFDPKIYKAWNEAIIKEKKIRAKWHEQYGTKLDKFAEDLDEEQVEDTELPCTCKDKEKWDKLSEIQFDFPRKGATGTNTLIRIADTPSEMKIPPPIVKSKLYEGISHDGKGRADYLKTRWKEDPENNS
ncbi:hypothetical protein HNY73_019960 [Argiope bruennichi]|uniref:Sperm microtubule inner protein 1 C-terminal domain-containing protein n=1 Tax=Argiope bruennichi TaxID=94029 RepID=A0A8T0E9M8_ARGBR|nr:hypothetical protein HNY73_019960 [Argiope bruennichi]